MMTTTSQICLISLLLCFNVNIFDAKNFLRPSERQKSLLHDAFGTILNLNSRNTKSIDKRKINHKAVENYMRELFKKFKKRPGISAFNTIRSISPKLGNVHGRSAMAFDIPPISGKIFKAEIHMDYSWRQHHIGRSEKFHGEHSQHLLHCLVDGFNGTVKLPLKSVSAVNGKSAWYVFDATQILISSQARNSIEQNFTDFDGLKLTVRFQHRSVNFLSTRKLLRHRNPFLLVFTYEWSPNRFFPNIFGATQNCTDADGSTMQPSKSEMVHPESYSIRAKRYAQNSQTVNNWSSQSPSRFYYYAYDRHNDTEEGAVEPTRSTPVSHVIKGVENFSKQGPAGALEDAKEARRKRKKQHKDDQHHFDGSSRFRGTFSRFGAAKNRKILPFGRRKWGVSKEAAKNDGKILKNAEMLVLLGKSKSKSTKSMCRKHDLVVEFADIGWADFIVAPTSFDAHYCAGSCAFPLSRSSSPSNHAVIQSIIQAVGLHPGVPEISCAPEKMDSLTLLHYDQRKNLVLKNYPKMTVESCSCL